MTTLIKQTTRIAAYGLVVADAKILLCRLSQQIPQPEYVGFWTLPGGGVEFGEAPDNAMVREIKEETSLSVEPAGVAGIDSKMIELPNEAHHGIRIIYFVKNISGELAYEIDGTTDMCAWFSLNEAQDLPLVDLVKTGLALVQAHNVD
ncbi:MAG: NUDIX domain-containing protein [Pseudomonadota bacterium]